MTFPSFATYTILWRLCFYCTSHANSLIGLLAFNGTVDVANKQQARPEPNRAEHQEEAVAHHQHVTKEEARLHEAAHIAAREVVVEAVPVDEERGAASAHDASPPPPVVLHRKLEVRQRDGDEARHDNEDEEHDEQDRVDRVHLVSPHGREDVVQLDVDSAEGKEASHAHLRQCRAVPRQLRNLTRVLGRAAWRGELGCAVLASNTAEDRQRERDERPDQDDDDDRSKRQRGRGAVDDRDGVKEAEHEEEGAAVQDAREEDVAHPRLTAQLAVVARALVSGNARGQRVQDDDRRVQRSSVVRVEDPDAREDEDADGQREELRSRADERAEEALHRREAEHVAVDVLPARLLLLVHSLILARVLHKVILQHAHQNGCEETGEKQHGNAAVDDGEPVDLEVLRQERVAAVLLHAALERDARLLPLDGVRELNLNGHILGDVHRLRRVGADVDLDHAVVVVRDVEVYVREEVVAQLGVSRAQDLLHLSDEAPDGKVVVVHLEVVVIRNSLAERLEVPLFEHLAAQLLVVTIDAEADVVRRRDESVRVQHLAKVLRLVLLSTFRRAERQVVVLVRLRRVVERTNCIHIQSVCVCVCVSVSVSE